VRGGGCGEVRGGENDMALLIRANLMPSDYRLLASDMPDDMRGDVYAHVRHSAPA